MLNKLNLPKAAEKAVKPLLAAPVYTPLKSLRTQPLLTDPQGQELLRNIRRLLLAKAIEGKESTELVSTTKRPLSAVELFGSGVQAAQVRKKLQGMFSNEEIRKGVKAAVKDKNLRRDLYTFLPASKGKLPPRLPERKSMQELRGGAQVVEKYLGRTKFFLPRT